MRTTLILAATLFIATGSMQVFPLQDSEAEAQAGAARQRAIEAEQRAAEERAERALMAREAWLEGMRRTSESNLDSAAIRLVEKRAKENERKFMAAVSSSEDLVLLSQKVRDQLVAGGAQSISVSLFADVERIEEAVKKLRKEMK